MTMNETMKKDETSVTEPILTRIPLDKIEIVENVRKHELCCESPSLPLSSSDTEDRDGLSFSNSPHKISPLHITRNPSVLPAGHDADEFSSRNALFSRRDGAELLGVSAVMHWPHNHTITAAAPTNRLTKPGPFQASPRVLVAEQPTRTAAAQIDRKSDACGRA
jgi:hypothetical protein